MRLLVGALVLSLVVATTAAVFAIWPVVGDAPWEEEGAIPTPASADRTDQRCEIALGLRDGLLDVLAGGRQNISPEWIDDQWDSASRDVERYC